MKLKKLIASVALASLASAAFADSALETVTSNADTQILVKNNFGECVTTLANRNLKGCGEQAPQPQIEMINQTITLAADTYFDFDKSVIKPDGQAALQQLAQQLQGSGAHIQKITVVGNTDSKGSDAYNQKLSERRAAAVGNYLIQLGIPASIIEAYGNGERNPVADNKTAEGRAQNRRVDIAVQGYIERQAQQ